jgi:hypothetical protein
MTKLSLLNFMQKSFIFMLAGGWLIWIGCTVAADFDTAYHTYQAGDYREASRDYQRLARDGDARSQYQLGLLYLYGQGVDRSPERGIDWLKRSAQNGYYLAAAELGQIYGSGRGVAMDSDEAARWIKLSTRLATAADAEQECE